MAQLFSRRATTMFRVVLVLVPLAFIGALVLAYVWARSCGAWNVGAPASQPIPFRHDLHAGVLRIDCRYCHASVERAAHAGMPSAQTCMTCHSQVWVGAGVLEPLRTSLALNQAIQWTSVNRLPDHSYFHHAAHVAAGVACETCHGRIDRMPKTVRAQTLSMGWCLDCHRDPEPHLRPPAAVFAMGWTPRDQALPQAARNRDRAAPLLTSCSICHR
jgi:Cytochrome c7 and related cytochrome c